MTRLSSFIIKNIENKGNNQLSTLIQIGDKTAVYTALFDKAGIEFPDGLDVIMMHKDFDYHREFIKILNDFHKGEKVQFPINLFKSRELKKAEINQPF